MDERICRDCKRIYLLSNDFFYWRNDTKKYRYNCRNCKVKQVVISNKILLKKDENHRIKTITRNRVSSILKKENIKKS